MEKNEEALLTTSPLFRLCKLKEPSLNQKMERYGKFAVRKSFKKGECIFRVGEVPSGVYYIENGTVDIVIRSRDGAEKVLLLADQYYFLGGEILFHCQPAQYLAITRTPVQAYWFEKDKFLNILRNDFDIAEDFMYDMSLRVRVLARQIEDILYSSTFEKVVKLLFYCSTLQSKSPFKISQQDLAALLGVHRNSLGNVIAELKQREIVETEYGNILIKNEAALKELVMTNYP